MNQLQFEYENISYFINLNEAMNISIPLSNSGGPNCFNAPPFEAKPLKAGNFIGDTRKGAPVNFYNVFLNPHGNGTHTECVGHISKERYAINDQLIDSHFVVKLITCNPTTKDGDLVINVEAIQQALNKDISALIIRTLPNTQSKKTQNYSNKNPAYLSLEAMSYIVSRKVNHLLIDLPSVDKEDDGGQLLAHKAFWNFPENPRLHATITEMVFVPDEIDDGLYFCNLQIPPFQLDAAPSTVILYPMYLKQMN